MFKRKENSVIDGSVESAEDVPGWPGCTLINVIKILLNGHNFFRRSNDGEISKVYKVNISGHRIMLCSYEAMKYLYTDNVHKDLGFGSLRYNVKIMDQYIPLMFQSNDELHHKRRKIFSELAKVVFCKEMFYQDVFQLIEEEFCKTNDKPQMIEDFEESIAEVVSNILSEVILGEKINYQSLKLWFENCVGRNLDDTKDEVYVLSRELQNFIMTAPNVKEIMKNLESSGSDLTETEVAKELLFSLIFNGWAALKAITVSQIINLKKLNREQHAALQQTCKEFIEDGYKKEDFNKLISIESFVLETYRMFPPATFVFGIASDDFVISLETGKFQVNKDDLLSASIYLVNRDPEKFEDPDEFDPDRFVRRPELSSFVASFGVSSTPPEEISETETSCAGKKIAMTLSKLILCHLLHADIKFSSPTSWSGNKIRRFVGSDKPVKISHAEFKSCKT